MKLVKNIFTVSFFAIMVVAGARAEIVSKTNIVAGDNVAISKPTEGANSGKIVISATDTNTTYTTGTSTYSGTTKLYDSTGTSTDGTMTRGAITTALSGKQPTLTTTNVKGSGSVSVDVTNGVVTISGTDTKYTLPDATADTKGGVRIMTLAGGIDGTSATEDAKVPTVAAAWDIANIAAGNNSVEKEQGTDGANKALITNASGTVTTGTIATNMITDKAVIKGKLAAEVQTSLGKADTAVQTVAPTAATAGKYVTNFTKNGTTVTATTAYVQIPVGSATAPTSVASIWIE